LANGVPGSDRTKSSTVPFEASFFLAVKIMELAERKHVSEEEFVAELKRLRERHNIMVGEWLQTRGLTKA